MTGEKITHLTLMRTHVAQLERELKLPEGFYLALVGDDDWSFIIKLHALIETALGHLLEHELARPELGSFLSSMSIGGRVGKLNLAKKLGCLMNEGQAALIERVTEIRNRCVHDVRNTNFSLRNYVAGLNKEQLANLERAIATFVSEKLVAEGKPTTRAEMLKTNPQFLLWLAGIVVIAMMYMSKEKARLVAATAKVLAEQGELLRSKGLGLGAVRKGKPRAE